MINQPKPAPTAPREYAIPDEECLPKYFKEPAPTAEEHDENECARCFETMSIPYGLEPTEVCNICAQEERLELKAQLDAALRSNREKDAQLERERSVWCDKPEDRMYHAADRTWWKRVEGNCVTADAPPLLAEKDAKIAELTDVLNRTTAVVNSLPSITGLSPVRDYSGIPLAISDLQASYKDAARARNGMYTKLEAQFRAVSEALKEKLETQRATHEATLASIPFYWASEVDARDARLRSIVDGKD